MKNGCAQNQSMRHGFSFQARLADFLEMPEREYSELICDIETDPIFAKLKYSQDRSERAIRSKRLQQTELSRRFFELKEEIAASCGEGGAEVEKLLDGKKKLVRIIRDIGEEKFTRYFIYNEDELSLAEIAECCGLTPAETKDILWLVNTVDIHNEFFISSKILPGNNLFYSKIAVLLKTLRGIEIQFTSSHWARGLYEVDYEKIKSMTAAGKISKEENTRLKKLLEKIELVNLRKSLMYGIISRIIEKQGKYLRCHMESSLIPFLQRELAEDMKVHPSIISRATAGRSLETPWGEEIPLKALFFSVRVEQKEAVSLCIKKILEDEKTKIENGLIKKPSGDKIIAMLLHHKYGINISQRTVAKYRNIMKFPGAFHR